MTACRSDESARESQAASPPSVVASAPATERTGAASGLGPDAFAAEWSQVLATTGDEARATASVEMERRWRDAHLKWTGYVLAGLCVEPSRTCAFMPWDRTVVATPPQLGGFAPLVTFDDTSYGLLKIGCRGQVGCVATIEGRVRTAEVDPERPLKLDLGPVRLVTTRPAAANEPFFRAPPVPASKPVGRGPTVRTGAPSSVVPTLPPRVF